MSSPGLQHALVSSYLPDFTITSVIGHDVLVYRDVGIRHLLVAVLVRCAHYFFAALPRVDPSYLSWFTGGALLIVYGSCMYQLIDTYMDTFVISETGLILFEWNHPFSQDISVINRLAIEGIQHAHRGFWHGLFNTGDIVVQVEDTKYLFRRVHAPMQTVNKILHRKHRFSQNDYSENKPPLRTSPGEKSYETLIEALGEVMHEYIKNKENVKS